MVTQEVWRSPELMLTLKSRDADPRSAQVDYRPAAMPGPPDNE